MLILLNAGPSKKRKAILATSDDFSKTDVLLFSHGQAIQCSVSSGFSSFHNKDGLLFSNPQFFFTQQLSTKQELNVNIPFAEGSKRYREIVTH